MFLQANELHQLIWNQAQIHTLNLLQMMNQTIAVMPVPAVNLKIPATVMTRASFCNYCNFFLQLLTAFDILRIYVVQRFKVFLGILDCNPLQLFSFLQATFYCSFY